MSVSSVDGTVDLILMDTKLCHSEGRIPRRRFSHFINEASFIQWC